MKLARPRYLSFSSFSTSTWGPQTALVQNAGLAITITVGRPFSTASAMETSYSSPVLQRTGGDLLEPGDVGEGLAVARHGGLSGGGCVGRIRHLEEQLGAVAVAARLEVEHARAQRPVARGVEVEHGGVQPARTVGPGPEHRERGLPCLCGGAALR